MRRWLPVLVGAVLVVGVLAAVLLATVARDDAGLAAAPGPGTAYEDLCAAHEDRPRDARATSAPPTSGPHEPDLITDDGGPVDDDALLHALELGNVVLAYDTPAPPPGLRALQEELSGPFDAEVAAAGQAVVLARRADADGVVALAWARAQRGRGPEDPALRAFAEYWLGRGYAGARAGNCPPPG